MQYENLLAPEAAVDLKRLRATDRSEVRDAIEQHVRHKPTQVSRGRIKRLQGLTRPQYRLRVGKDVRVFYDVVDDTVEILAIVSKAEAKQWLERYGER